jgi:MoaA/NifB/PqqE/SkfB family radical SAM enzyme
VLAFGRVLAAERREGSRAILVGWLGGEPLQWPAIHSLARVFHHDLGLRQGLATAGPALASARVRAMVIAHIEQLTISIDGLGPFHDGVRDAPGLFEQLRASIARLRSEDPTESVYLRVNTVLMRGNIADFGRLCEAMAQWGFRELTFNPLGGHDRPEFFPANRLLPDQVRRFADELPELRLRMSAMGLRIRGGDAYLERIAATAKGEHLAIEDCHPGTSVLFVDERGRASPCSFTCDGYGVPIAEIDSPQALRALPARFAARRRAERLEPCGDCHATHVVDKFEALDLANVDLAPGRGSNE